MPVVLHIRIETRKGIMRREREILREEEKKVLEYRWPEKQKGELSGGSEANTVSWATRNGPEQSIVGANV